MRRKYPIRNIYIRDFASQGKILIKTGPFGTQLKAANYKATGTPVINVRNIGYGEIRAYCEELGIESNLYLDMPEDYQQLSETSSETGKEDVTEKYADNELQVSETTYYVDNAFDLTSPGYGPTIILEPDGTCAYFAIYATGTAYYYGQYETTADGIVLHLTLSDGSALDIPLFNKGSSLVYAGESIGHIRMDEAFDRSDGIPPSVQDRPPYSERASSGAASNILARVTAEPTLRMREDPETESYVLTAIPYQEIVEIVYDWNPQSGWTMVQYNGVSGWVSTEYLEPYNAAGGSITKEEARSLLEEVTASMPNAEGPMPMEYYGIIETNGRSFHSFWMSDVAGEGEDLYAVNAQSGGLYIIRLGDNTYMPFDAYYRAAFSMTDLWTGESVEW